MVFGGERHLALTSLWHKCDLVFISKCVAFCYPLILWCCRFGNAWMRFFYIRGVDWLYPRRESSLGVLPTQVKTKAYLLVRVVSIC